MIILSEITPEDVYELERLERECFSQPYKAADFLEIIDIDYAYYITAKEDGRILGCCGVRNMCGDGEITNVAVFKDCRRRGIGELMLSYLMNTGLERGIVNYTLEVRAGNEPAKALYEKLGFTCAGVRKNFYEMPTEDGLIYWKYNHESF